MHTFYSYSMTFKKLPCNAIIPKLFVPNFPYSILSQIIWAEMHWISHWGLTATSNTPLLYPALQTDQFEKVWKYLPHFICMISNSSFKTYFAHNYVQLRWSGLISSFSNSEFSRGQIWGWVLGGGVDPLPWNFREGEGFEESSPPQKKTILPWH